MIKLEKLKNKGFEIKKRRIKTLDGMKLVDITAIFTGGGGYEITFAFDGEKLYEIDYIEEKIATRWGEKTKLKYITKKDEVIKNITDLYKRFKEAHKNVPFEFEKYLKTK